MKLTHLHDLLQHELQDLYSGEQQIIEALPKMIKKTTSPELKKGFEQHLEETKKQLTDLEDICKQLGFEAIGEECAGMKGIIEEGAKLLEANDPSPLLDLALIGAAQRVEHYEVAGYGTATNYAQEMGHTEAQEALHAIMEEERTTDKKLSEMAETLIQKLDIETLQHTSMPS